MAPILSKVTFAGIVAASAVALLQGTDAKKIVEITADTTEYTLVGHTAYSDDKCLTGRGDFISQTTQTVANRCVKGPSEFYLKYTCPNGLNKPALLEQYNDEDCTSLSSSLEYACLDDPTPGGAKMQLECFAPTPGSVIITQHVHDSQSECLAETPTETPTMLLASFYAHEPNACTNSYKLNCNSTTVEVSQSRNQDCSGESTILLREEYLCDETNLASMECISIVTGNAGSLSTSIGVAVLSVIAMYLNASL